MRNENDLTSDLIGKMVRVYVPTGSESERVDIFDNALLIHLQLHDIHTYSAALFLVLQHPDGM